jgi:ligand-binding sensor domain-containing protein/signal transduction histidine kinase
MIADPVFPAGARTRRRAALLVVVGLFLSAPGAAAAASGDFSQSVHTAWRVGDRVLRTSPRALAQTTDGYLWLGTERGLIRFDGNRFTAWEPTSGRLPSASVVRLLGTRDGSLWVGTTGGLTRLKDGMLVDVRELAGTFVSALIEDRNGVVWAGTNAGFNGAAKLCAIRRTGVECDTRDGRLGRFVSTVYEDSRGALWVGAATGLWRWDIGGPRSFAVPGPFPEIHSIVEDDDHSLLVAINHVVMRLNGERLEAYAPAGAAPKPLVLLRDDQHRIWVGRQDGGLLRLSEDSRRSEAFSPDEGLSGYLVFDLLQDRDGDVWVATINGLDRFRTRAVSTLTPKDGLSSSRVTSILATPDASVWVGTAAGLNRWSGERATTVGVGGTGYVASLFQDRRGRLWVSSPDGLVYVRDGHAVAVPGVGQGYVHSIAEDGDGNLWVADQERGLLRLRDGALLEVSPWTRFGSGIARTLAGDPRRAGVWLGFFAGGVSYFTGERVEGAYRERDGLGRGAVSHVAVGTDGAVWAATEGGLSRIGPNGIATLSSHLGLPCDRVHWSIEDDAHALWIYTECGLVKIGNADLRAWAADARRRVQNLVFDGADGVSSYGDLGSYSPKVTKSADGRLWFATYQGVNVVDPRQLRRTAHAPEAHVEQVIADEKVYDASSAIALPPGVRDVRFDYTGVSLGAADRLRFRYRLEGRDRDWIDASVRRQAFYTDLSPKTYRFFVNVAGVDGVWSPHVAALDLSIEPAFYQTWTFDISVVAAGTLLVWVLYRRRLRYVAAAINMRFEERLADRIRIAQELHDTLLQEFVSASMHLHVFADELSGHPTRPKLDPILRRVTHAIEEGRRTMLGLQTTPVSDELERALAKDAAFLRGNHTGELHLVVEGTRRALQPLIRDEIYRIVREALANAFRHAAPRRVDLEFEYSPNHLRVRVRDDGSGIEPTVLAHGRQGHWGISGMRARVDAIDGATLRIWSRLGIGTEIELIIDGRTVYVAPPFENRTRPWWWRLAGAKTRVTEPTLAETHLPPSRDS